LLGENPSSSVGVLYIAPLKALINDQFSRLNFICEEENINSILNIDEKKIDEVVNLLPIRLFIPMLPNPMESGPSRGTSATQSLEDLY